MRKHEIPDLQKDARPCQSCMHAAFAHEGDGHEDRVKHPNACNLCMCKEYIGAIVRGDMSPEVRK